MKKIMFTMLTLFLGHLAFGQIDCSNRNLGEIFVSEETDDDGNVSYETCNSYTTQLNVVFNFPNDELTALTTGGLPGVSFLINFGDGAGPVPLTSLPAPLTTVSTTYPSTGEKTVHILMRIFDPFVGFQNLPFRNFSFTINETTNTYFPPDEILTVTTTETYAPSSTCNAYNPAVDAYTAPYVSDVVDEAQAYIRYGIGHTELVKPIIIVDGLDFGANAVRDPGFAGSNNIIRYGSNGWDALVTGTTEGYFETSGTTVIEQSEFNLYPELLQDVHDQGFDLIFLDFRNGSDYIQKNAILLKELLLTVNNLKVADPNTGTFHENIVVGASMGGQIARYALAKMEKDGVEHCTHTYISFDSPHQGANVTMGVQAMTWIQAMTATEASDRRLWEGLSAPAPRQLLIEQFGDAYQDGRLSADFWAFGTGSYPPRTDIDYGCLRSEYVAEMEALGYPQQTRNVAISCGSIDGVQQPFNHTSSLYDAGLMSTSVALPGLVFRTNIMAIGGQTFHGGVSRMNNCLPRHVPIYPLTDNTIFVYAKPHDFNPCLGNKTPYKYHGVGISTDNSFLSYDNAPGCYRADLIGLHKEVSDALSENAAESDKLHEEYIFPNNTKRQCFMPTMSTLDLDIELNNANMFSDLSQLDILALSPFDAFYAPVGVNLKHVEIDAAMKTWIMAELASSDADLTSELSTTYNFGLVKNRIPTIDINSGGVLRVNNSGPTGFLDDADSNQKVFEAYTIGCDGGDVTINSGGKFILGDDLTSAERRAIVHVSAGSKVEVHAGGTLRVAKGSQLIIESGAQLIIHPGANIDLWWNDFWFDGETIEGSTIHVKDGGELIINGDFDFGGSGFFQFDKGNIFTLNSDWRLNGNGKGKRFMRLNKRAELKIGTYRFHFHRGMIEYDTDSYITGYDGAYARFTFMDFEGLGTNSRLAYHALSAYQMRQINILYCSFKNFSEAIQIEDMTAANSRTDIQLATFESCEFGLFTYKANEIRISGSQFTPGSIGSVGLYLLDAASVDISSTQIKDFETGIYIPRYGADGDDDNDGIDDGSKNNTNIILRNGTTLQDNKIGINLEQGGALSSGQLFGSVKMDCARLIENGKGITGGNILMEIDACTNSNQPDGTCNMAYVNPNSFVNAPQGLIFDIEYEESPVPPFFLPSMLPACTLDAKANFWQSGGGMVGQLPDSDYVLNISGSCSSVTLDMDLSVNFLPEGCSNRPPIDETPKEPTIKGEGRSASLENQDQSIALSVFPNPTLGDFTVRFGNFDADITVKNVLGQTLVRASTSQELQVSTDNWEAGLYLIEVKNLETSESFIQKLVLQH